MTSEVAIGNLALSHLGERANISSLDPPEGSVYAQHVSQFLPIARDGLLERYGWSFATRRVSLAALSANDSDWDYAYAMPSNALRVQAILPPASGTATGSLTPHLGQVMVGRDRPQPYIVETASDGTQLIRTNQTEAVCKYTVSVTDPKQFSPLFVTALSHWLASMLAGPVIKGKTARSVAMEQLKLAAAFGSQATVSDANQQDVSAEMLPSWIADR